MLLKSMFTSNFLFEIRRPSSDDFFHVFLSLPDMLSECLPDILFVSVAVALLYTMIKWLFSGTERLERMNISIPPPSYESGCDDARRLQGFLSSILSSRLRSHSAPVLTRDLTPFCDSILPNIPLFNFIHSVHILGCHVSILDRSTGIVITSSPDRSASPDPPLSSCIPDTSES